MPIINGLAWPIVPFNAFVAAPPVIPQLYWDVYSSEQRWKAICENLEKQVQYMDTLAQGLNELHDEYEVIYPYIDQLFASFSANFNETFKAFKAEVEDLIAEIQASGEVWDVTQGKMTSSKNAMRNLARFLTPDAYNISQFAETYPTMTVAELSESGLSTQGWAVTNTYVMTPDEILPEEFKATKQGE